MQRNVTKMRHWGWRISLLVCVMAVCVKGDVGGAHSTVPVLEFHQGTLTASLSQVPLASILREIHEHTGLTYSIAAEEAGRAISVEFESLPLATALAKILVHVNYAMVVDRQGQPRQVIVAGRSEESEEEIPSRGPPSHGRERTAEIPGSVTGEGRPRLLPGQSTPGSSGDQGLAPLSLEDQHHMDVQSPQISGMDIRPPSPEGGIALDPANGREMEMTLPSGDEGKSMIGFSTRGGKMDFSLPSEGERKSMMIFPPSEGHWDFMLPLE